MIAWWCAAAHAGAWTRDAGSSYAKAGVDVYRALRFVAPGEGDDPSDGTYFAHQYGLYAEIGLLRDRRLQAQVQLPLTFGVHTTEVVDALRAVPIRATTARLGDLNVGLQTRLHRDLPLAIGLIAKIPCYGNGGVGADYPSYAEVFAKPGDGQVDLTGWLYGGVPFSEGFAEAGLGYRHRTEWFVGWADRPAPLSFVDSLVISAKAGRSFGPVLPILGVEAVLPLRADEWTRQYVGLSASALIDLGHGVALEPRLAGEVLAKRTSQGIGGGLGLSYRR